MRMPIALVARGHCVMRPLPRITRAFIMAAIAGFGAGAPGAVSAAGPVPASAASAVTPTTPQVSVQLWSVREDIAKDFTGTLQTLASMGFQGVEFARDFGPYADDPEGLRKFLATNGLQVSGAHVQMDQLQGENLDSTVAFYRELGCRYLIVSMDVRAFKVETAGAVAADLTAVQQKLAPLGMQVGYHNHKPEMQGEVGKTPWDVIAHNTPQSVILQQDVAWTAAAGKNPVDVIHTYPGRIITTHYKAAVPGGGDAQQAIIGADHMDWKALLEANSTAGGTQWLVVEQEVYPPGMTPLQSVAASLKGLQSIMARPW
jgi:sugar phosphate isomerase/epimerase